MRVKLFVLVLLGLAMAGCSLPAQNYRPSVSNVQSLRTVSGGGVAVGSVSAKDGDESRVNDIRMRGSKLVSPYGSFAGYIEAAVKNELGDAGKLQSDGTKTLSGILLKNSVNANGINVGIADIEVQFTVNDKSGRTHYQKSHSAHHEWPSSLMAAVALPAVQENYHVTVQKLLASLFGDKEFIAAIKK